MPKYIYARVSRKEQKTDSQINALLPKFPDAIIREEKGSGVKKRPVLEQLLSELKPGDTLAIYALDRLGRNKLEAAQRLNDLVHRGILIHSMSEGDDFATAEGEFKAGIMLQVAQLEHRKISARIRAGMAAKKAKGLPIRDKRKFSPSLIDGAISAIKSGLMSVREASRSFGISRQYCYVLMRENRP